MEANRNSTGSRRASRNANSIAQPPQSEPGHEPLHAQGEEQVIALVYPVGTDTTSVLDTLREALSDVNYTSSAPAIHLIGDLADTRYGRAARPALERAANRKIAGFRSSPPYYRDYMLKMDLGDSFREDIGQGDETDVVGPGAMGLFAASRIFLGRRGAPRGASRIGSRRADNLRQATEDRHAYIVRSLKVPQEIDRLRAIYGDALTVLAINSDENDRRDTLMWKIHESARTPKPVDEFAEFADRLIARDTRENTSWGQYVSEAFSRADVFVDASHPERLKNSIDRIVQILFRYRFHTPTRDEYGMFHAYGASLRSSDLSRQVGASIVDRDGEIVALGTNDVPKAGGGQYWPDQNRDDGRDFRLEKDKSTEIKRRAVDQFLHSLSLHGHIKPPDLTAEAVWDWLEGTDFMNVGEFGRATHAEMSALMHAARRGRPVERCTLYTTTYPCHVCTRHILQAGIERVVFNEPYPKSLARYLHPDSISMGNKAPRDHVPFEPFVGLSPTLYLGVFRAPRGSRRTRDGRVAPWPRRTVRPIKFGDPNSYVLKEAVAVDTLSARLEKRGKPGI